VTGANTGSATDAVSVEIATGGTVSAPAAGRNQDSEHGPCGCGATIIAEVSKANDLTVVVIQDAAAVTVHGRRHPCLDHGDDPWRSDQAGDDSGWLIMRVLIGAISQPWFSTRVRLTSVAACLFGAGLNETPHVILIRRRLPATRQCLWLTRPTRRPAAGGGGVSGELALIEGQRHGSGPTPVCCASDRDLKPEFYIDGVKRC
jgi:hypothetical protein